ncbi:MAG: SCO family protein [Calditrichaceae bacterium]|nr:SCO family protein [Calditrichaceae bacterium]
MKVFRIIILFLAAVIVLVAVALSVIQKGHEAQGELPVLYELPDFTFMERQGTPFGKNEFIGKISIVDFIFTNCPGPCPFMSSKMAELYQIYADTDKVQFVSISVDPNRDSLSVLKTYAGRFGVTDDRWVFLRAPMLEIMDLYENGFKLGGILPVDHSTKFILVDHTATIRGYYDCYDEISLKILKMHIRELAKKL